jgi:V8-like Glu-specific endopeptidase
MFRALIFVVLFSNLCGASIAQTTVQTSMSQLELQPMPVLPEAERPNWTAIGPITTSAEAVNASCTGALIAPDLVLTAAHCVGHGRPGHRRYFVAGWNSGRMVMRVQSTEIRVHPMYTRTEGNERVNFDIATVRLERPIPSRLVTPIPIRPYSSSLSDPFGIVGYHNRRPDAVNGRFDCKRVPPPRFNDLHLTCFVISGNSGSPVLVQENGTWTSIGVLVATLGAQGAIAVPHDTWVMLEWTAALERAKAWK